jgi:FMN phosphatase YigB (HAD superfamily)
MTAASSCARSASTSDPVPLPPPRALLLDFGGVIADGPDDPDWGSAMVEAIGDVLAGAGVAPVPPEVILASFVTERRSADRFWRTEAPVQRDHASFWGDVIAADWPAPARAAVAARGAELSRRYMDVRHAAGWRLRTGMAELLADAGARGLPVAIVSNTLCGQPHREFLDRAGLSGRFAAQFYSDEQGIRKPNPELARRAVAAVGVPAGDCWFVGDTRTRDVLVARRAALGAAILMRSLRVEPAPMLEGAEPDAEVADPVELHALLTAHWRPARSVG